MKIFNLIEHRTEIIAAISGLIIGTILVSLTAESIPLQTAKITLPILDGKQTLSQSEAVFLISAKQSKNPNFISIKNSPNPSVIYITEKESDKSSFEESVKDLNRSYNIAINSKKMRLSLLKSSNERWNKLNMRCKESTSIECFYIITTSNASALSTDLEIDSIKYDLEEGNNEPAQLIEINVYDHKDIRGFISFFIPVFLGIVFFFISKKRYFSILLK